MILPQHPSAAPDILPAYVIDNHTHLRSTTEYSGFDVADSFTATDMVGVAGVVDVGRDLPSSRAATQLATTDPRVRATVATHPNDTARLFQCDGLAVLDTELAELPALAALSGVVAVSETGLDYYRTRDVEAQQMQVHDFQFHIALAREDNLTLVIRDHDTHMGVLEVLGSVESPERTVIHCFSRDADFIRECVDRGFQLSYPGVVTSGPAGSLREAAKVTPLERILVETSAPYLMPKPQRGKPNAPYLLPHTVTFLAGLFDIDLTDFCHRMTVNTEAACTTCWGDNA